VIADYLKERRWFRGKSRTIKTAEVVESFPLDLAAGSLAALSVVKVVYEDGGEEKYVRVGETVGDDHRDALAEPKTLSALLEKFKGGGTRIDGKDGALVFRTLRGFDEAAAKATSTTPLPSAKEQTNTSIPYGDAYILKIIRKLDEGRSAELEMGEYLTKNGYASAPAVLGAIEIDRGRKNEPATVGIIHRFSPNRGDAWQFTLDELKGDKKYDEHAATLGKRVREMHDVLAKATDGAFAPEPIDRDKRRTLADAVKAAARGVENHVPPPYLAKIDARVDAFVDREGDPVAHRVHGDLHLGQILVMKDPEVPPQAGRHAEGAPKDDFIIIDFEGEPARPLEERKAKRSPMADIAGMVRSFDYAAATAKVGREWYETTTKAFLAAYGDIPRDVLDFYLLEKCIYEIGYEANNRPDWIGIPLGGLRELLA